MSKSRIPYKKSGIPYLSGAPVNMDMENTVIVFTFLQNAFFNVYMPVGQVLLPEHRKVNAIQHFNFMSRNFGSVAFRDLRNLHKLSFGLNYETAERSPLSVDIFRPKKTQ